MAEEFLEEYQEYEKLEEYDHVEDLRTLIYNEKTSDDVDEILMAIKFDFMIEKFRENWIDFEAFMSLETQHIVRLFSDFPLGVAIKFENSYKMWKSNTKSSLIENQEISNKKVQEGIVTHIFNETDNGQKAVNKMDVSKKLDKKGELLVCQTLSTFFISNKIELSINDISFLADEIEKSFPNEKSSSYFDKATKRGPLYDKYHNSLRAMRIANNSGPKSKKMKLMENFKIEKQGKSYNEDEILSNDFVKSISNSTNKEIFMHHWNKSSKIRIDSLRRDREYTIGRIYPILTQADGYIYINKDFEYLYPQKKFQNNWITLESEMIEILKKDVAHEGIKSFLSRIETLSYNQKVAVILLGLSCHLHGSIHTFGDTKKSMYKPTVYDVFSSILLIVSQESELDLELKKFNQHLADKNMNQQALIIGFGTSVENLSEKFCVYTEDLKYMFDGKNALLRALESTIKIYHLFDLEYPTLSKSVYSFLSIKFFNIEDKKPSSSKITRLLNSFTNKLI